MNNIIRFGTDYGGFYYPENLDGLDENSIIYCIGAGEDISHDIVIGNKLQSKIYILDPTPRAIKHYELVKNVFEGKSPLIYSDNIAGGNPIEYWNILMENKININNIIYKNYALGNQDGIQKFYLPSNQNFVSCSLVEGMKGNDYINVNVKKLRTVMNELGHTHIDLLKLDIEGSECDVIENMLNEEIYPKYLAVEFDLAFNGENIKDVEKCNNIIQLLYQKNYELIYQNHSDFTFYYKNIKKYDDKKILFLLNNPGPPDRAQYQHTLISFAEGLKEQNINYDANINYYKTSDEKYLFNKIDNINYNNYDYIITSPNSHYLKECHYKENDNIFITKEFLSKKIEIIN